MAPNNVSQIVQNETARSGDQMYMSTHEHFEDSRNTAGNSNQSHQNLDLTAFELHVRKPYIFL